MILNEKTSVISNYEARRVILKRNKNLMGYEEKSLFLIVTSLLSIPSWNTDQGVQY